MRIGAILLLILLAACENSGAAPAPSPQPNFSRDPATGITSARIALDTGDTAEMQSGKSVRATLPTGVLLYPGATIERTTVVTRGGARRMLVEFETPDPIAKVILFHRAQAQASGAAVTLDLDGTEAASIGGQMPSGQEFALTARRQGDGTAGQLSIADPPRREP